MKKGLMAWLLIFYRGSFVYGQGSGAQSPAQGNKGYLIGAPREKNESKAQEMKERHNPLRGVNLIQGIKKMNKWIEENLW